MNTILLFLMSALMGVGSGPQSTQKMAETVNLTINYEVLNTRAGYSYDAKLVVYVDGKEIGESSSKNQEVPNSVTLPVPTGSHRIKAVLLAKYDDVWEERTVANDYSNDFVWETEKNFKKDGKVKLYFDIDSGVHENKKPKKAKKKK